jgi:hypothetical protein
MTATVRVRWSASPRASALELYSSSSAAARTRSRSSALTPYFESGFSTRDAVASETPLRRATAWREDRGME